MLTHRSSVRIGLASVLLSVGVAVIGCTKPESTDKKPAPAAAYPLSVCVVSDEPLGSMGDPHVIQYEGREVKFCCAGCEKDFRKDPQRYMKKLTAAPATQPTTKPS